MSQINKLANKGINSPYFFLHNKLTKVYIKIIIYIKNHIDEYVVIIVQDYTRMGEAAELLKVLGHPIRLCIVSGLVGKECNVTTMQNCLGVSQPVVSQHIAVLKNKGVITGSRKGTEIIYSVADKRAEKIVRDLFPET